MQGVGSGITGLDSELHQGALQPRHLLLREERTRGHEGESRVRDHTPGVS